MGSVIRHQRLKTTVGGQALDLLSLLVCNSRFTLKHLCKSNAQVAYACIVILTPMLMSMKAWPVRLMKKDRILSLICNHSSHATAIGVSVRPTFERLIILE